MRSGKWQMTEGIELPNQEKNQNTLKKGNPQILGNIGTDTIKQAEMKENDQTTQNQIIK